jgi:hypothetical protein
MSAFYRHYMHVIVNIGVSNGNTKVKQLMFALTLEN